MSGLEIAVAMGGAYLLDKGKDVGEGAIKDYLQSLAKGKLGDLGDKFKLELKAAKQKAIDEFMTLFFEELRHAGVTKEDSDRYYVTRIESFIKEKKTVALLGKPFDTGFKGFNDVQISEINEIWMSVTSDFPLPKAFEWQILLEHYKIKVRGIRRDDKKLKEILDSETWELLSEELQILNPTLDKLRELTESIAPIPIEFDLDGYRKSLQDSYGDLNLSGLDNSNDQHGIQLRKIFIEQNAIEGLPPDRSANPDSDEDESTQYRQKSAEPVLKVIRAENCQRAVLLGDPGSGKSSLLQYLALDCAEDRTKPLPLLIELREYALDPSDAKNFLDFLSRGMMADWKLDRHQLHEYLRTKPSLVMFDGLDEIFDSQLRKSIINDIANFATQQYPNAKIVVTSRVVGYNPDRLRRVKFRHFTLQELDESQIQEFIDKWYQLALGQDPQQDRLKQRLKEAIDRSPAIRILANNPLLLTLMATLNQQGSLPTRRVDLYNGALQLLLHNWDITVKELEEDPSLEAIEVWEKQEILGKIAYEMQFKEGMAGNLLDSQRLKQILTGYLKEHDFPEYQKTAKRLIEQLRTRSFILCAYGADAYGFVHRTFLEYFCAKDFVLRLKEEPYPSLKQLRDHVFARYWQDETWHEVLKLICGLLEPEQAGYLVEFLMDREVDRADYFCYQYQYLTATGAFQHLRLATECWAEVKSPKPRSTAQKLKEKLKEEIESQSKISLSDDAAELLLDSIAQYYHTETETLTWFQDIALNDQNEWVRRVAVKLIGKYYHNLPESLNCLKKVALNDENQWVRRVAVESIGKYYPAIDWLQQVALNDQDPSVQKEAVESIGKYYHNLPETINCLQQVAFNAQHEYVREAAVESISEYYRSVPESLNCLRQVALNDQHEGVRLVSVNSIAQYYHTKPETLTWLQQLALNNQHQDVRQRAVWLIAQRYHTEPETLNCLQQIALNAQHQDVRQRAVWLIAQRYHTEPETLNWLQDIAFNDQDEWVRQSAVCSIAEYCHTVPEILNCLQQVALNDQDEWVRQSAVYSIAEYYIQDDRAFKLLCQIASQDPYRGENDRNPRKIALEAVVENYIDRPEVIELLRDRSTQDPDEELRIWAEEQLNKL
jgi:hypothetical protein